MRYVPPVLIRYRYPILVLLSLLLISEMVLAGIGPVPIEYEWVLGWLLFLTVLAWAGIAGVIGVGAPVGGDIMKHGGRILIVLSLALFAIFLAPFLFLSQYIVGLLGWLYGFLLIVVWTGIVVIVGAISNLEHGMKTYLLIGVFPLLMLLQFEVFWTELLSINLLMLIGDLLSSVLGISRDSTGILSWMLALLFIVLSNSLVLAAAIRGTMDNPRIVVALVVAFGISAVAFAAVIGVALLIMDPFIIGPLLVALPSSVLGTALIGTMRRPVRNLTVSGISLAVMIITVGWYWYLPIDDGLDSFSGEDRRYAERGLSRTEGCVGYHAKRVFEGPNGTLLVRGYTWWRFSTDCR